MAKIFEEIFDHKTPPSYKFFSQGKWQISESGQTIEVTSPIDNQVLGRIQNVSLSEINKAIDEAKKAQKKWLEVPTEKRAQILHLVADWLREEKDYLSTLLAKEIGKDLRSAEDEIERTAELIDYFAQEGKTLRGEEIPGDVFPGYTRARTAIVSKVPLGLVLAIAPFNYPVNLSASKIAPALVTGNAVLFKPPSNGAISALHLVRIFEKAGVPKGILAAVTGKGSEIGDYLVTHPEIDMISFTGSSKVGKEIAQKAGMIPLLFECGGNNPAILLPDADFETATLEIVKGAFSYSGQRCTAVKYVLGTDEVLDKLLPRLKKVVSEQVKMGDPRKKETKMVGPVISLAAALEIEKRILEAKIKGAKIVLGGKIDKNYIEPTILDKVTPLMEIVRIETFGPVLSLIRVKNINEAIEIINNSSYGLQASIFTKDEGTGIALSRRLDVGTVQINSKPQRGPDHFPFLGIKDSGVGVQGIRYTLEAMVRPKPIVLNKPE